MSYFIVVEVDCVHPVTLQTETLRLTDRHSYVGNGWTHVPYLNDTFNFEESLFDTGTTGANVKIGVGTVSASNNGGIFDKYRFFGFDGQRISIYNLSDEYEVPSAENLSFSGTVYYASLSWDEVTFYVKNRFEELNVKACKSSFLGTNEGPQGLEGGKDDLKGKSKPMLYGQCVNIPWYRLNSSLEIYGCNFDKDGNRKAVAAIMTVLDKGGEIHFEGDVPDYTTLQGATVTAGMYQSCLAEGLIKLGTPARGDVTGDVYEAIGEDASAPRVVRRILEDVLDFVSGIDFDPETLQQLHESNPASVGVFIEGDDKVLDVCSRVLDSIGGYHVPDFKGMFFFGRVELPNPESAVSAYTFNDDIINKDNLNRLMTGDQGHGIPCATVTLNHTLAWKYVDEGSVLESVPSSVRGLITSQWRSSKAPDISVLTDKTDRAYTVGKIHKLAPDLTFDSLLVAPRNLKLRNGDFSLVDKDDLPQQWDTLQALDGSSIIASGGVCALTPSFFASPILGQHIGFTGPEFTGTSFSDEICNGRFVLRFKIESNPTNLKVWITQDLAPGADIVFSEEGWQEVDIDFSGDVTDGMGVYFSCIDTFAGGVAISNVSISFFQYGLSPEQEAERRFRFHSADTERYMLSIPYFVGKKIGLGSKVTMQCGRFGMEDGKMFLVIGRSVDSDDEIVSLDLLG